MSTRKVNHLKEDPTAASRKKDHINLAFESAVPKSEIDSRFYYEPMLSGHPKEDIIPSTLFGDFILPLPIWVSSMTGGTDWAATINTNLAKACGEFGMGMGLGSCRSLLMEDDRLSDFAVKSYMPDQPLFANLGIAQIEQLVEAKKLADIKTLLSKLDADGLIIHVNPLQEWLQPEGDRYYESPIDLIKRVLDFCPDTDIIVKEVGQGFGPKSIKAMYELPLTAVDFAASGGTNFSMLELLRSSEKDFEAFSGLAKLGHSAEEMVELTNQILDKMQEGHTSPMTIISGGIKDFLDGYYCIQKLNTPAMYGQASGFLRYARESYEVLQQHINRQISGLRTAYSFLTVK